MIVSARVCKTNAEQMPDILTLHLPPPAKILDMTYGNGVFWRNVPHVFAREDEKIGRSVKGYKIWANDIDPTKGVFHHDFADLPSDWSKRFAAVVLDPPYLHVGGIKTLKASIDRGYNNKDRALRSGAGFRAVHRLYTRGFLEANRVLAPKGKLIFKCMDQIESGKQCWDHIVLKSMAEELGFYIEDMFVYVSASTPTMRHRVQKHARRNHSYWIVGVKR